MDLVNLNLPNINVDLLFEVESKYKFLINTYKNIWHLDIDEFELNNNYQDILYKREDLNILVSKLLDSNSKIKDSKEYSYLLDRGITDKIISKYKISTFSYGFDKKELDLLGISTHPMLETIFLNDTTFGIILPIFEGDNLSNVITRRLINGPLKYTLSIPDTDVFGLNDINEYDDIWLCEGYFDYIAIKENGKKVVTVSSASLSTIQMCLIINKAPKSINIFADYDYTGLKSANMLKRLFNMFNIETNIFISNKYKDASEHFLENKLTFSDVEEISVTDDLLDLLKPEEDEIKKSYRDYLLYRKI